MCDVAWWAMVGLRPKRLVPPYVLLANGMASQLATDGGLLMM